jgi:hypothetical protein
VLRGWVFALSAVPLAATVFGLEAVSAQTPSPSAYVSQHPRLAFTRDEIPALQQKVHDGGHDDEAYEYIRALVTVDYPRSSLGDLMGVTYGMNFLLNIGLVTHLDADADARAAARELGRSLTIALADSFAADDDEFYAPIRLRALCYGYDMCMETASEEERAFVREEIESYLDALMLEFNFERWLHPPYTSNITTMIGSSLGLAAICLAGEIEEVRVDAALARADSFLTTWMRHHLDPDGACFEGVQYGTWVMRHLPWYSEARRRFDGYDYSQMEAIRNMERWLAYEILPERGARVNNLNDTAYLNQPFSRHNTFIDWALARWSSGLSAWTWERILGREDGFNWGQLADRASTALWYRPIPVAQPGDLLPPAFLWRSRGLYYYRTGWPRSGSSDDVVFSFYSGPFHGGHSQEDQNSFTLYAFGTRLSADNGFDVPNAESEAHNMVFIDGKGQHHSRQSVGTDGRIAAHILSQHADYLFGDATQAYSTYSPLNRPGYPFPDSDWSWGYDGGNPVEYAYREWIVVHEGETPPYFILLDDIKKDNAMRTYDWRMHTEDNHSIDASTTPIRIDGVRARLFIDVCYPAINELAVSTVRFTNPSADPDTRVLVLSRATDRGVFALVLRPEGPSSVAPETHTTTFAWGGVTTLEWPQGLIDVIMANVEGDTVSAFAPVPIATDARLAQFRFRNGALANYAMAGVTSCAAGELQYVRILDGSASVILDGSTLHIDRAEAEFVFYAPDVTSVRSGGAAIPFAREGAFVRSLTGAGGNLPHDPRLLVYPQPSSGTVTIVVEAAAAGRLMLEVFDVGGRRVRTLWDGPLAPGHTPFAWDGRDNFSRASSSGVYFVRAQSANVTTTTKVVLVR